MRKAVVSLLALAPIAAHAVMDSTSTSISGGVDTQYSWVGQMSGASAVAIGPHTILTAAHVGAGDFLLNGSTYQVASTATAPKVGGSAVDLRIVQTSDLLPGWYELGTKVASKNTVTMVGFGSDAVVNADGTGYSGREFGLRHSGENTITKKTTVKGRGPVLLSLLDDAGEAVVAGGDSGGGWFMGDKLVGITDFNYSNDPDRPDFGWEGKSYFGSGAIDLTNKNIAKWVGAQIALGNQLGGDTRNFPAQAVPEPGTWAALGLGALALLRRRK